jgi:hypothetical protein
MAERTGGYAFTLKGEGINFVGDVTQVIARTLLDVILKGGSPDPSDKLSNRDGATSANSLPRKSLREFLNDHEAKRIPEKIVTIGEYLTVNGAADFSKDEVLTQFRIAREAMPGNFRRDFSWAVATGWIAEDIAHHNRFYVTQSGKQAVSGNFSDEITKHSGFRSVRRKRRRS